MKIKVCRTVLLVVFVFLLSACRDDAADRPGNASETPEPQSNVTQATVDMPTSPDGAAERAASTLAVPESTVEGIILPEYYEFDYPEELAALISRELGMPVKYCEAYQVDGSIEEAAYYADMAEPIRMSSAVSKNTV